MSWQACSWWCAVRASAWLVGSLGRTDEPISQYAPRPTVIAPARPTMPKRRAAWLERPYDEKPKGSSAPSGGSVKTVGSMLAQARMDAGMSIDDLAYKSKLRATIIAAIESDDFSLCGGEVYARGQVRALAALVGLDPEAAIAAYEAGAS
jgi:Helix-turn-helix domain